MNPRILSLPKCRQRKAENGFTLLEILVALTIVATGIAAVVQATSTNISTAQALEQRVLSTWVAANRLTELRLSRSLPATGEVTASVVLGGREWYYREQVVATPDPDLLRVNIWVYADEDREDETGYLFGYLGKAS